MKDVNQQSAHGWGSLQNTARHGIVELDRDSVVHIQRNVPGGLKNIKNVYPLLPTQEGLLFHGLLEEQRGSYVLSALLELRRDVDRARFLDAVQTVVDRHDALRTAIFWEGLPQPVQVVHRHAAVPAMEVTSAAGGSALDELRRRMRPECRGMDVSRAPLVRVQFADDCGATYALLDIHHLVCDDQSWGLAIAEVLDCLSDRAASLARPASYEQYVEQVLLDAMEADLAGIFRDKFSRVTEPSAPFDLLSTQGAEKNEVTKVLDPALAARIRTQCASLNVRAARLFHAAWALVTARTSGRADEVVFGTVLSTRPRLSRTEPLFAVGVNTLPLRITLGEITASQLLARVSEEIRQTLGYKNASLAQVQKASGMSLGAPLFTALLNYRHRARDWRRRWDDEDPARVMEQVGARVNTPVNLSVDDDGIGFTLTAQTDVRLSAQRLIDHVEQALRSLLDVLQTAPETAAARINILPGSERERILKQFNSLYQPADERGLMHEVFERHAQRTPAAVAIRHDSGHLTYAALNSEANQLARRLREAGLRTGDLVAICMERGYEPVLGVLAVLKAGGAFVPLDPTYPEGRLDYMLKDASPAIVLTQRRLRPLFAGTDVTVVQIDDVRGQIGGCDDSNLSAKEVGVTSRDLAYVIYTSGSTGQPKGVMIEHRGLTSLIWAQREAFALDHSSHVLQLASFSFDAAVWEIIMALCHGATLHVTSQQDIMPGEPLLRTVQSREITHATVTPSALSAVPEDAKLPSLHTLVVGGESCSAALVRRWNKARRLINAYGPTEVTVCATMHLCEDTEHSPPIGRPLQNTNVYILDEQLQPVPIGVRGEICVGGRGVARGYLGRPELTSARFVTSALGDAPGERIYRTGDLGRWREDGAIEYLGRNDRQVKVRGFRIELREIEHCLSLHAAVGQAIAIVREDVPGVKQVVAYLVPMDAGSPPKSDALREHLRKFIPEYMLPSAFVVLRDVPLTPTGKLDHEALPAPDRAAYVSRAYESPRGLFEETLAQIWQSILKVERVGRGENFFELGGHSLLAMQLITHIRKQLRVEIPVRLLFEFPTIDALAVKIEEVQQRDVVGRIRAGDAHVEDLLKSVASMSEDGVRRLLHELAMEAKL